MQKKTLARLSALCLSLSLLLLPAARALNVEQAREIFQSEYVDPVPREVLDQPTIQAMVEALGDPYTEYFTPEEYAAYSAHYEDATLVGIGVSTQMTEQGLLLVKVYAGSPAAAGGLLAGDVISAVDGKATAGRTVDEVSPWIQGEAGTSVDISYLRGGVEAAVTLKRAAVSIPTASAELVDGHIGYIDCTTFGTETARHFFDALDTYRDQADRWVVDLRGNGGGMVTAAVDAVGAFTGPALVGYIRNGAGEYGAYQNDAAARTDKPLIVLSDVQTASASELFSAAVRDAGAGIVVGGRTYGKGVGQSLLDQSVLPEYFPDGDALKITSFRYFSGNGATTHVVGVVPHLVVSSQNAADAAYLLSSAVPADSTGYLQLELEWRWYIDLETAASEPYRAAFTELLEAIPANVPLYEGAGGSEWTQTTPAAAAAGLGLDYRSRGFSDADASPYGKQIDLLGTYGIVSGDGSGAFRPNDTLTRAQLCALLAQALNCNVPTGDSRFSDVDMAAWYGPAVNAVAEMGLVSGVGGGKFAPDAPVDHQQLIAILGRLADQLSIEFYEAAKAMPADALSAAPLAGYADWAREGAWLLSESQKGYLGNSINLLWDEAGAIDPAAASTRGEAAWLVYAVLYQTGVLPN
ncbi:hypothetical protein CE91St41_07550 [Oscillospiraceae bacterium]|nr:hypothetical protein CE91St40_07550 [Oscillospiraceae bacterium]BDF73866.1 hypothetical protein CE91St41_07550 [Oscillospiraceae bacterium]